MNKILLSELIAAIAAQPEIKKSCALSTLEEGEDLTTIKVENSIELKDIGSVVLMYEVLLDHDEEVGGLVCSGIDPNTENTWVQLTLNNDAQLMMGGHLYTTDELLDSTDFKEAILDSELNQLTMDEVDGMLKQILPEYAVNSH